MPNTIKLYAAYKAGYLGDNILDTYFSFFANIISEEHLTTVEDAVIAGKFKERYRIELPLPFVRQVLGIGVENCSLTEDHGKYSVDTNKISKHQFRETEFDYLWSKLIDEFSTYCESNDVDISTIVINDFVLDIFDDSDEKILSGEKVDNIKSMTPCEYCWYKFVKEQGEQKSELYTFISALSISNITKQGLFYTGKASTDYSDLHIYLDSPIVFALLGMDDSSRTESYLKLINDSIKSGCNVHVLDHNYQEVDSIITRAAGWATNIQYDLRKANNAARFFHDTQMSESEISEFCGSIETKLNDLGITVKKTSYDIFQNQFQEDETRLYNMVMGRYLEHGYDLSPEKEDSIRIDVRSIIMIYRERQGQTATKLQNAKHIMLTSNNAIANVSKKYESNQSTHAGHIPACISADLFGAILWLDNPVQMLEYQKKKLLADCYAFLKPDKILLDKYIQSLDNARNEDKIDEKQFLFLRTHKVVLDSLMNITKGDYARFNSNTYREVYEDIQAKSQKQYKDEVAAHEITRVSLENLKASSLAETQKKDNEIEKLKNQISLLEEQERNRQTEEFEKKVLRYGWFITIVIIGIPYFLLILATELIKNSFSNSSGCSVYMLAGALLATIIAGVLYRVGKNWCFKKVRFHLEKRRRNYTPSR